LRFVMSRLGVWRVYGEGLCDVHLYRWQVGKRLCDVRLGGGRGVFVLTTEMGNGGGGGGEGFVMSPLGGEWVL
jgi:hypothetical protein